MLKFFLRTLWTVIPLGIYSSSMIIGVRVLQKSFAKVKRQAWIGCLLGTACSLGIFLLKTLTVWLNKEYLTIAVNSTAIIFEILLLFLLLKVRIKEKKNAHSPFLLAIVGGMAFITMLLYLPDILLVFYQMYVRGEEIISAEMLLKLVGCVLGTIFPGICFFSLNRITRQISEKGGLQLVGVFTGIQIFLQFPAVIQPLLARRIIPMYAWLFDYIVFMNNHSNQFQLGLLLGFLLIVIGCFIRSFKLPTDGKNAAVIRKKTAFRRSVRRYCGVTIVGIAALFAAIYYVEGHLQQEEELSPAEELFVADNQALIPLEQVNDGHLHRFEYTTSENVKVRFIVILKNGSNYGVGLDACDICGATGYYERNDEIVCKLCDVVMNRSTIGFKGGCNPVPLAFEIRNHRLVIETASLDAEQSRFE